MTIARVAIHPAIGIMRVGNSADGYFIGPELPGARLRVEGGFKDDDGTSSKVKRQAARFRVFGFDEAGTGLGELTLADAEIEWTVTVANTKAEWDRFEGTNGEQLPINSRRKGAFRNRDVGDPDDPIGFEARKKLKITPDPVTIRGPNQRATFDNGLFFDMVVPLGEARTDENGRLLVLGGRGVSASFMPGQRIANYANNDWWHDDVSDGPVTAKVKLSDGRELIADPAWVICAPPDFSPDTINVVTLYDVVFDTAIKAGFAKAPAEIDFYRDIQPILNRGLQATWTSELAYKGHANSAKTFDWQLLGNPAIETKEAREAMLARIRNPHLTGADAEAQANKRFMPALAGDNGDCADGRPDHWLHLTVTQYDMLVRWAAGDFKTGTPVEVEGDITPEGLDRAALEACAGGAFYPGIEAGWITRNPASYVAMGRLDPTKFAAGDLTKRMAVPWQADFFECNTWWWPAQRPDFVVPADVYQRIAHIEAELANPNLGNTGSDLVIRKELTNERAALIKRRELWTRGVADPNDPTLGGHDGDHAMVQAWNRLGFVVAISDAGTPFMVNGEPVLLETDRALGADMNLAEAFYRLVNIERFPEFRPTAKLIAEEMLSKANYGADSLLLPFPYTVDAFRERMNAIYEGDVAVIDAPVSLAKYSKQTIVENLRQKAPMNLVDGAWLANIMSVGPCDEVRARLFAIWNDEAGNGTTELNHCNVYDTLLRSVDIYLPAITTEAFRDLDFIPSAWQSPVFQLAVGLFPENFFPELLGMTLYLEWEATPTLLPAVRFYEGINIDPQFYRMHAGIDNVTTGHGALAREAIELHLDQVRRTGGDDAVQTEWRRIWNGYVAWFTLGTFGQDLQAYLDKFEGKNGAPSQDFARARMADLIRAKAPYARTAHGARTLGGRPLGELFDDPDALMDALAASALVNPDSPRDSTFITDTIGFRGPMYKVFNPKELDVVLDWIGTLRKASTPAPSAGSSADRVFAVINDHIARAAQVPAHKQSMLPDAVGNLKSLADWFAAGNVDAVMTALAASQFIVAGDPDGSQLIAVFKGQMAGKLTASEIDAFRSWITDKCPPRESHLKARLFVEKANFVTSNLLQPVDRDAVPFGVRRQHIGVGALH
ncbi:LodA/GoxA family CTQ-dependent oxidase [Azospirillum palustre]